MYRNKNKGWVLVEAILALALLSIVILPVFSQSNFFIKFLHEKPLEMGEERLEQGTLKGVGFKSEIEVEITKFEDSKEFILVTDREGEICR